VGAALAWSEHRRLDVVVLLVTLATAVLIQVGTNLHNDVSDFERGADDPSTRLGPARATAQGWLTASHVRLGAYTSFLLALALGAYLVWAGGWPILVIGLLSIGAGVMYSGGPRPLSHLGLGELFVWLFFGLIAVVGTYYLQSGTVSNDAVVAGVMIGLPAGAVLVVNNYRDLDNDRKAGKRTLAVRFGRRASQFEYALLMLAPFILLLLIQRERLDGAWWLLPWLALPAGLMLVRRFISMRPGPGFNGLLAATASFQLAFGVLLSLHLVIVASG
jgi:1,4-dihydroxy-2-naphthoate octaprenyltransferase